MSRKVSAAQLYAIYPWQELRRTDGRWLESQVKLADSESWISLGINFKTTTLLQFNEDGEWIELGEPSIGDSPTIRDFSVGRRRSPDHPQDQQIQANPGIRKHRLSSPVPRTRAPLLNLVPPPENNLSKNTFLIRHL